MEVDHGYGQNCNTTIIRVTLVLCDTICVKRRERSKTIIQHVVVEVGYR